MKIRIGTTERIITLEYRSFYEGEIRDFMNEHYPRKHGWDDEEKALAYLQTQLSGNYIQELINADLNELIRDKSWTESGETWVFEVKP